MAVACVGTPHEWTHGIQFIAKRILRLAIIFYGFRLTFQQVAAVGLDGLYSIFQSSL